MLLCQYGLAAGLNTAEVQQFLDGLAALAEPVETHFLWRPRLRDPADEVVLEAAVNGQANAIVPFDLRDYGQYLRQKLRRFRMNPADFCGLENTVVH